MPVTAIARRDALAANPWLAHAVIGFQAACHPHLAGPPFKAGDHVWLDIKADAPVRIDAATADRLNDDAVSAHQATCDDFSDPFAGAGVGASLHHCVAAHAGVGLDAVLAGNGRGWHRLVNDSDWGATLVLPAFDRPILDQDNDFPAMVAAQQRLTALGIERSFSGGLLVSGDDVVSVLADLFRVARFNAAAPQIYISAERAPLVAVLCKSANFHFSVAGSLSEITFYGQLERSGLAVFEDGVCTERFSGGGAIEGRRWRLD